MQVDCAPQLQLASYLYLHIKQILFIYFHCVATSFPCPSQLASQPATKSKHFSLKKSRKIKKEKKNIRRCQVGPLNKYFHLCTVFTCAHIWKFSSLIYSVFISLPRRAGPTCIFPHYPFLRHSTFRPRLLPRTSYSHEYSVQNIRAALP